MKKLEKNFFLEMIMLHKHKPFFKAPTRQIDNRMMS